MDRAQMFKLYGYKEGFERIKLDKTMNKIYHVLYQCRINERTVKDNYPYDLSCLKGDAEKFFNNNNILLHSIPALNLIKFSQDTVDNNTDFTSLTNYINPLDLYVEYAYNSAFSGEVGKYIIDNKKISNYPIIFLYIRLGKSFSQIVLPSYIHEITHTVVDSVKGSVLNYQNAELLSIFMEKLAALQIGGYDFLETIEKLRWTHTLECMASLMVDKNISSETALENSMYIASSLQASYLFDIYLEGDADEKEEIIKNIQGVFDGEASLEAILADMDIDMESSTDLVMIKRRFGG